MKPTFRNVIIGLALFVVTASLAFTYRSHSLVTLYALSSSSSSIAFATRRHHHQQHQQHPRRSEEDIVVDPTPVSSQQQQQQRHGCPIATRCKHILRTPSFSDFPAYTWPNASQLLGESPSRSSSYDDDSLSSSSAADEQHLLDLVQNLKCEHPQLQKKQQQSDGIPTVRLFVPWKPPFSYMSPYPLSPSAGTCSVRCELTNSMSNHRDALDGYVVDTNGAYITEVYDWVSNPRRLFKIAFNTENVEGRRAALVKGYGLRYLASPCGKPSKNKKSKKFESPPCQWNASFWDKFDFVASYQTESQVFVSFFHWALCRDSSFGNGFRFWHDRAAQKLLKSKMKLPSSLNHLRGKLAAKSAGLAPVLFFVRNCDFASHRRAGFMRRLAQQPGFAIDSVGKCENNRAQESVQICSGLATNRRSCIIAAYKFYLAIENSISLDYVSEKAYGALLVGTIPIYLGAPNAADLFPAAHSVIMARDFSSLRQLSEYVKCVARNATMYEYYTSWFRRPLLPRFKDLMMAGRGGGARAPLCQVCEKIAALRSNRRRRERAPRRQQRQVPGVSSMLFDVENSQAPLRECLS